MSAEAITARPASTVLLLRDSAGPDGDGEIEMFMMVRHHEIDFNSGALVFPGGSVDPGDRELAARTRLIGDDHLYDPASLYFRIAAIRETFEESGILLAKPRGSDSLLSAAEAGAICTRSRAALCANEISFEQVLADNEMTPALDLLVPYAHWITPVGVPKRFDTHFFVAEAPPEQAGAHDGKESTDSLWVSPREALAGGASGRFKLPFPTTRNLIKLGGHRTVSQALDAARQGEVVTVMPVVTTDGDKRRLWIPAEAGYDGEVFEV